MAVERGTAGTGAVLSLDAIGKQDTFLLGDDKRFTPPPIKQHTNFATVYRSHILKKPKNSSLSWPFDKEVRFKINPKTSGDILANAYLQCELPSLSGSNLYCQSVGDSIIKEIKFIVDGNAIDIINGDWSIIHNELFNNESEKRCHQNMIGPPTTTNSATKLFIPLYFFFHRSRRVLHERNFMESDNFFKPYFYTCACWNNDIEISITFQSVSFFSNATVQSEVTLPELNVITQEFVLTDNERLYLVNNPQQTMINTVAKQPVLEVSAGSKTFKNDLTSSLPVKSFHWFLRDVNFEDSSNVLNFNNRYNFSWDDTNSNIYQEFSKQIITDAKIYLSGGYQIGFQGSDNSRVGAGYYKYTQSFQHHLEPPTRNIYTYSFSIDPRNPTPTGALNFAVMDSSKTVMDIKMSDAARNSYKMHLYYLGYKFLRYENGFVSTIFS